MVYQTHNECSKICLLRQHWKKSSENSLYKMGIVFHTLFWPWIWIIFTLNLVKSDSESDKFQPWIWWNPTLILTNSDFELDKFWLWIWWPVCSYQCMLVVKLWHDGLVGQEVVWLQQFQQPFPQRIARQVQAVVVKAPALLQELIADSLVVLVPYDGYLVPQQNKMNKYWS